MQPKMNWTFMSLQILDDVRRGKLTFAEKLKDGKMDYGSADSSQIQTDLYVGNGSKGQTYAPRFCWHGFRYVLVEGDITDITCDIIHTDIKPVGEFVTKNSVINGYIDMFLNSLWSNMHCGVPSDCPHRERLGYTGDGQLTAGAAMRFADLRSFYRKWMRDIADGQCQKTGHVQHTAPFGGGGGGPAGWGGAVITVPYNFYRIYKERDILEEYFPNMQRYVAYMEARSEDDLVVKEEEGGWCLGEWCAPGGVTIDPCFVNTCMYIEQLSMLLDICGVIGDDSAENIKTLIDRKRDAVRRKFIKADDIAGNKQGAAAFAYMAGVIDAKTAEKAIKEQDLAHLDTGIFGTPRLIETLLRLDMDEKAVELLSDTGFPSFGYMLENGATTLWECWNGGGSHNHHMFSDLSSFLYKYVGGISPDEKEPGFRHTILRPAVDCGMESASASHDSMYGEVACYWANRGGRLSLNLKVPFGCHATLYLPKKHMNALKEGDKPAYLLGKFGESDKEFFVELSSGEYQLTE